MEQRLMLGISSCLLGHKVRYDGGHKYDSWLVESLGNYVDYIPVCPEVGCGLPVPREAMRLVGDSINPRLLTQKTGIDHTQKMQDFCKRAITELKDKQLCGFVFKSKSPSSGMERVKVYPLSGGAASKTGVGIFARSFMEAFPLLPVEEEGRLHDPVLRENFIERIFIMHRWLNLLHNTPAISGLMDFHTRHKLLIMAHSPVHYRSMGALVARSSELPLSEVLSEYHQQLMTGTKKPATPARHQNVLLHIMGYFKKDLSAFEKAELVELIDQYKKGLVPLIVPVTLLNHYVRKYGKEYLAKQLYLKPHPVELKLRNHC